MLNKHSLNDMSKANYLALFQNLQNLDKSIYEYSADQMREIMWKVFLKE